MSNNNIPDFDSYSLSNFDNSDSSESVDFESETDSNFESSKNSSTINLTPFNMKEELEEGYFDNEGTYHLKKKAKFSDHWLEYIDSYNIQKGPIKNCILSNQSTVVEKFDFKETYEKILDYLQPEETIAQALCRLGRKNSLTTMERLKLKKLGTLVDFNNSGQITELTGLVNDIFANTSDIDIYQKTSKDITEMLNNSLKKNEDIAVSVKDTIPTLDMFSDSFLEKETIFKKSETQQSYPS